MPLAAGALVVVGLAVDQHGHVGGVGWDVVASVCRERTCHGTWEASRSDEMRMDGRETLVWETRKGVHQVGVRLVDDLGRDPAGPQQLVGMAAVSRGGQDNGDHGQVVAVGDVENRGTAARERVCRPRCSSPRSRTGR
ncbi:hypothetical protein GCM10029964_093160 [Kibdelosporangium lantanae]